MLGLRVHGPGDLRLEEMPRPSTAPDEVLVKIAAAGICGTDLEVLAGTHGALLQGTSHYPMIPGHEWAGYVAEAGSEVTHLQVGDLVVGETGIGCLRCALCLSGHHQLCPNGTETGIVGRDGAMRQYHTQKADLVHKAPLGDPELAALVEPASVGVYACHRTGVSPLDRVAVVGGGAIGQLCLQAARSFGARFTMMVTRSEPKLRLARELGADIAVSSAEVDIAQYAAEVTDGERFDVVIEAAGTEAAFYDALLIGGYTSRIGLVGLANRTPLGFGLWTVIDREQTIIGVRGSPHVYPQTIEMMMKVAIQGRPLISHSFSVADYQEAFTVAAGGGADVLKVLLRF
jgi:threonine dehydrogenase-like Zn-dependent dehydrogenase